jgi:hypothetical protein
MLAARSAGINEASTATADSTSTRECETIGRTHSEQDGTQHPVG